MAVPLVDGEDVIGVLRCCTANKSPWIFTSIHLKILDLVAVSIRRFWINLLKHMEETKETESWNILIEDIFKLNRAVLKQLDESELKFDKKSLFRRILHIAENNKTE